MKRILLAIITLLVLSDTSQAAHIKGGFFKYEYLGPGAGTNLRYRITLTVYMICNPSSGQLSNPINFSIFNAGNRQLIQDVSVGISNQYNLGKVYDEPCITGNEIGCYYTIVVYDLPSIELPSIPAGYTIAYQRCCRIAGINNIVNSGAVGNTFSIDIPGSSSAVSGAQTNSSPVFLVNDTAVICRNSYFQYSFQASDINGDSLAYEFCDAIEGADQTSPAPTTASSPPYFSVPYQSPYSGTAPMGAGVTINPLTGLISGIAPGATGEFVVSVCVKEYRNGQLIGRIRKELHIRVGDCEPLKAQLDPMPTTCNGTTVSFQNGVPNPSNTEFFWTFGEPISGINDTAYTSNPSHQYLAAGDYTVKLRVSLAGGLCADSSSFVVKVYPGFRPGFKVAGGCFQNPFQFTDTTETDYGFVDTWSWNFGDGSTLADTSHIQNPQWTFASPGPKTAQLTVTNSKGCVDVVNVNFVVLDKPPLTMAFTDTLICIPDPVTLGATGTGAFNWTPVTNISNPNIPNPTVNPTTDTWYVVNLNDNGCLNKDSVHVRVVAQVNLAARGDSTICLTDGVQLNAVTNGLSFQWTASSGTLSNPNIVNPIATPTAVSTTYRLRATIGSCFADDEVVINTVPYPVANAGAPQVICYNTSAQLSGSHDGQTFSWSPTTYLNNPTILNPIATPPRTTAYVLTVFDNAGCPKPGRDTVVITVQPKIKAFAGNDTTVVVGQPLQFNGTGGVSYVWSPSTGLNNPNIFNPIGVYNSSNDTVRYKMITRDAAGCADSAYVTIRVFKTKPTIFVPTAFTPNNDGLNDTIYPIAVGIQRINYFSIYNRWGQLVFTTTINKKGWDGRIKGELQNNGVFVWMVSAEDYLGNPIFLKGTVTLIR